MSNQRAKQVRRASLISIAGNGVLAVLKIVVGIVGGSMAVVGAGIDSSTDIVASVITLFAAAIMAKPPDERHPYGHRRAEAIATKAVAFVIFFAGAQLAISTVRGILGHAEIGVPSLAALYVTIVSIIGKVLLAWNQFRLGRRYESPMIVANARNMLSDVYISAGVVAGLVFTRIFSLPVLDPILALLISLWVMKTAVQVFMESAMEVMEGTRDSEIYDRIFDSVSAVQGAHNAHRARIRQLGNMYAIDLDIEVDPSITVKAGHEIAVAVEKTIKENVRNVYDIMVHVEPRGNEETDEKYGLSEIGPVAGGRPL